MERAVLEQELRLLAERHPAAGVVDDLELQHLVSVILHGALLLQDLYTSERLAPVYAGDSRGIARQLVSSILADGESPDLDLVARAGRLPDDVRLLGDKCLFDVGITRIRKYRGLDLAELGSRAYRMASEILGVLADDRSLRKFFDTNRLAPLPIDEEVTFLRQCAERFGVHADLLAHLEIGLAGQPSDSTFGLVTPRARAPKVEDVESEAWAREPAPVEDGAVRPSEFESLGLSRDELLTAYERIVLFAALDVDRLRRRLKETVIDQAEAVNALCDELALLATGTQSLTRPPSFFFVGPTGVGKNYLVESVVRLLEESWQVEIPLLTLDGPNYTDASDINELRGSTRGFIRSDEEGLLAEFHARARQTPLSFILVDEVEKAHPHLRKFFLGLMDRGTVTDNRGRVLAFAGSILVFTSNVGYSDAAQHGPPIGYRSDASRAHFEESEVVRGLRQSLSAEFVNRLRIIRFGHLSAASIETIFDLEFARIAGRFAEVHALELIATESARREMITRGYSWEYGARHLGAVIHRIANVEVSKKIKQDERPGEREPDREVLDWLRQIRSRERAFDAREVRARVLGSARVRVPYRRLTIDFAEGEFVYRT